ncbi:MAG: ABC transporter permease [Pseudomonadota bacterium]
MAEGRASPILEVRNLHVYYGQSHALQGVDLTLSAGVLSVVGRNGMGKTTLCKTIMGLEKAASGSISFGGKSLIGLGPGEIARGGIGYVPQGRRLWKSLSVDEHLRLVERKGGAWTVDRIYSVFPRLAERRSNGGGALSGGEQQMLAIGRALLLNPRLLVMDEPTEGLAPVIVNQVAEMLVRLGEEGDIDVLVIEQNIGVACSVAANVAIMVNGRINRVMDAAVLAADKDLQQALLGVGRHAHDETPDDVAQDGSDKRVAQGTQELTRIYVSNPKIPTRWSQPIPARQIQDAAVTITPVTPLEAARASASRASAAKSGGVVYVCGTLDTKRRELEYMRERIRAEGLRVQVVDLSTSGTRAGGDVTPNAVALYHPRGSAAVFTGDRATATAGMAVAFQRWVKARQDVAGLIGAGGSGGTAMLAGGFREAALGVPKLLVSTVASGDVSAYVGPSDMTMMHSVADVSGLNGITRDVLTNAAGAMAGMVLARRKEKAIPDTRPSVGLSMFGVTTTCVNQAMALLEDRYECFVFHATGIGNRCLESLIDQGRLTAVLDITTTDVCDYVAGGVFAANTDRLGAVIRMQLPYVGACGALDMVNFRAPDTVPERYKGRKFYEHNPQITLMRTTPDECRAIGAFIGERLNQMRAPVRFFLPEGGVSALDAPGQPFWDPQANDALFRSLEETVNQTANRQLVRVPHHINDPEFADLATKTFTSFNPVSLAKAVGA